MEIAGSKWTAAVHFRYWRSKSDSLLAHAQHRDGGWIDTLLHQFRREFTLLKQRRSQLTRTRSALNAVPALRGQSEKPWADVVETNDDLTIRHGTAKPGPGAVQLGAGYIEFIKAWAWAGTPAC